MSMPGMWEFAVLGVLALLIFGPEKLPGMAKSFAKTLSRFRREAQSAVDELKRSADLDGLSEVAGEWKSATSDLRNQMTLTGPAASSEGAADTASARSPVGSSKRSLRGGGKDRQDRPETPPGVEAHMPAPYDPYAT